jgi:hypothetical protein
MLNTAAQSDNVRFPRKTGVMAKIFNITQECQIAKPLWISTWKKRIESGQEVEVSDFHAAQSR